MKSKSNKILLLCLIVSIAIIIIGYFLWTILIPIQDFNLMNKHEMISTQKELALNYNLGRTLLYIGFFSFISLIIGLVANNIKTIKNKFIKR